MKKLFPTISLNKIQEFLGPLLPFGQPKMPWWIEVNTSTPLCTYYFGPFDSQEEARHFSPGYIEDLCEEGARDIITLIKQCQPDILTIDSQN
jgi:Domain of unknown function (DUF1816)